MPIPFVTIAQRNGGLASIPANVLGDIAFVAGPANGGDKLLPIAFMLPKDVESFFLGGPLVEFGANLLARAPGKHLVLMRTDADTDGSYGSVDVSHVTGACTPSAHASTKPYDEYDSYVEIITGGTVGSPGITYKTSLDGGRTKSATTALGSATSIFIADGNVEFDLTSATLTAGDYWTCPTIAPQLGNTNLTDAQEAIGDAGLTWHWVGWANPLTPAQITLNHTWLQSLWDSQHKHRASRGSVRGPAAGETEAQYRVALTSELSGMSSTFQALSAGYCEFLSATSGNRRYRRPASWLSAARALRVQRPTLTDLAQFDLGNLGSDVKIRDANNNRKAGLHDESIDPGLDDLRLETLYTAYDPEKGTCLGVYLTTPHIFASAGDCRYLWQYREVDNRIADIVFGRLRTWARRPLDAKRDGTGYITAEEKSLIDGDIKKAVVDSYGDSVTDYGFALKSTDNILAENAYLRGTSTIVPKGYPTGFAIEQEFAQKVG